MAFSWDKCIERDAQIKKRQDKCKALHNQDFIAKIRSKAKIVEMRK